MEKLYGSKLVIHPKNINRLIKMFDLVYLYIDK